MTFLLVTFINKILLKKGIIFTVYILKRDIESDTITKVLSRKKIVIFLYLMISVPFCVMSFSPEKKRKDYTKGDTLQYIYFH